MEGQRDKVSQMFGDYKKEVKSENDMKYHRISPGKSKPQCFWYSYFQFVKY